MSDGHDQLTERVAAEAHDAWSGWMAYMLPKLAGPDRVMWLERWMRQMRTPYSELPEAEKESDRQEARRYIDLIVGARP